MVSERKKLISVIVPVYNIKDYIDKCVESLIRQTYQNLQIFLVDDGSTDGSGQICDRYAKEDSRIIVLHKKNGGLSDARNYGLDRASGDLLAFVDGDDWVHPQMYELMLDVMKSWEADIVTCWFERDNEDFAKQRYNQNELGLKCLTGAEALSNIEIPHVVAWNKLYKREIFEDIRYPKGKVHEDEYVAHKIFYKCKRIVVINESLYFYTTRSDSIVAHMTPERIDNALEALSDRVEFSYRKNWTEVMPAVVKRYCDYCIDWYHAIRDLRCELTDQKYLEILWKSERDMVRRYSNVQIEEKYIIFARSPKEYDRWITAVNRRNKYYGMLKKILDTVTGLIRFK